MGSFTGTVSIFVPSVTCAEQPTTLGSVRWVPFGQLGMHTFAAARYARRKLHLKWTSSIGTARAGRAQRYLSSGRYIKHAGVRSWPASRAVSSILCGRIAGGRRVAQEAEKICSGSTRHAQDVHLCSSRPSFTPRKRDFISSATSLWHCREFTFIFTLAESSRMNTRNLFKCLPSLLFCFLATVLSLARIVMVEKLGETRRDGQ